MSKILLISCFGIQSVCPFAFGFTSKKAKKLSFNKVGKNVQLQAIKTMQRMLPKPLFEKIKKLASKHSDVGGKRSAAMYGMIGELQGKGDLDDMIKDFLDKMMK